MAKNGGNVGDSGQNGKKQVNMSESIKNEVSGVKNKIKDVINFTKGETENTSKLATEKLDSVISKIDSMSGSLNSSVENLNKSIVGISDVISSAFKRTRNDLNDLDKDSQAIYDRDKKYKEELNKATTKRAKQQVEEKYSNLKEKESERKKYAEKILESRQKGEKENPEDRSKYIDLTNEIKKLQEQEVSASVGIVETVFNKAVDVLKNVVKDVLTYFAENLAKGLTESVNFNLQNYTELAGRTGYGKETLSAIESLTNEYKSSGYGNAVNISEELKPMYIELAKQGLQGDNLRNTAITNTIDRKIMPWLETTSEYWITLSENLSSQTMSIIKGQQLALNQTEAGNRLLQTGVVSQLTQQMTPLLQSIKDDVFAQAHAEEIYQLAEGFVEGGYSPEQAKQMASAYLNMQMNPYQAITSGDVSQTLMALSYARGDNALQTFKQLGDIAGRGATGNMIASSAYANTFMASFDIPKTSEGLKMFSDTTARLDIHLRSLTTDFEDLYGKTQSSVADYVSESQKLVNTMNNFLAKLGDKLAGLSLAPLATNMATSVIGTIPALVTNLISAKMMGKVIGGLGGAGATAGTVGTAVGTGVASGTIPTLSTAGVALGTAGSVLGGVTTLATVGHDIYKGYKQGDRGWGLVRDAFVGTEQTSSNTLKQMAKYAGIGSIVGSLTPLGPGIGTAVGAVAGAGAGALLSLGAKKKEQTNTSNTSNIDIQPVIKSLSSIDTKLNNLKSISDDVSALNKKIVSNKLDDSKTKITNTYITNRDVLQIQSDLNDLKALKDNIGKPIDLGFIKTGFETSNGILSTISSDLVSDKLKVSVLNDFQSYSKDTEHITDSLSSVAVIADTLTTINETLTNGKVKVVAVSDYSDTLFTDFNNRNNKVSKTESKTESATETIDNDNYRAELLNRITNVGTEIVNAINNTAKPQNIKEINRPLEFSPSIENMGYLKSNTGLVNG